MTDEPDEPSSPAGNPVPGQVVANRYALISVLGRGANGIVFRAADENGDEVAVKWLAGGAGPGFGIEARLLERLDHPRVVAIRDHGVIGVDGYIVMDLVDGAPLPLGPVTGNATGEPVTRVVEACEALQYLHGEGVIHRDIKPSNLLAGPQGTVLVDFGIARVIDPDDPGTRAIGTPGYMAPEILVGERASARSDVYSLAATLWAMLTGAPPRLGDPGSLGAAVGPGVQEALLNGLTLRPERRITSAAALASALGSPLGASRGSSLALTRAGDDARTGLLEAIVRGAAAAMDAAAASIALISPTTGELVYEAAWGAGAQEIVGVRLPPSEGIAGAVVAAGTGEVVPDCRADPRFAQQIAEGTGYVPVTMLVVPLRPVGGDVIGALSLLDRRDGSAYGAVDLERAGHFGDLTAAALA